MYFGMTWLQLECLPTWSRFKCKLPPYLQWRERELVRSAHRKGAQLGSAKEVGDSTTHVLFLRSVRKFK